MSNSAILEKITNMKILTGVASAFALGSVLIWICNHYHLHWSIAILLNFGICAERWWAFAYPRELSTRLLQEQVAARTAVNDAIIEYKKQFGVEPEVDVSSGNLGEFVGKGANLGDMVGTVSQQGGILGAAIGAAVGFTAYAGGKIIGVLSNAAKSPEKKRAEQQLNSLLQERNVAEKKVGDLELEHFIRSIAFGFFGLFSAFGISYVLNII